MAASSTKARSTVAAIRPWSQAGAPSLTARRWIRSWRTCSRRCRPRPSTTRRCMYRAPGFQPGGRLSAWWTPRFRCNGRRIAPALQAERRRHSFAVFFGGARRALRHRETEPTLVPLARAGRHARGHRAVGEAPKARAGRRPGRQVIDRRECCGRRLTGQRLTGAHALKWLPPHRSHALRLSLPGIPLSIGRSACLRLPPTYSCRRRIRVAVVKQVERRGVGRQRNEGCVDPPPVSRERNAREELGLRS